jgi:hypothetical protein
MKMLCELIGSKVMGILMRPLLWSWLQLGP